MYNDTHTDQQHLPTLACVNFLPVLHLDQRKTFCTVHAAGGSNTCMACAFFLSSLSNSLLKMKCMAELSQTNDKPEMFDVGDVMERRCLNVTQEMYVSHFICYCRINLGCITSSLYFTLFSVYNCLVATTFVASPSQLWQPFSSSNLTF